MSADPPNNVADKVRCTRCGRTLTSPTSRACLHCGTRREPSGPPLDEIPWRRREADWGDDVPIPKTVEDTSRRPPPDDPSTTSPLPDGRHTPDRPWGDTPTTPDRGRGPVPDTAAVAKALADVTIKGRVSMVSDRSEESVRRPWLWLALIPLAVFLLPFLVMLFVARMVLRACTARLGFGGGGRGMFGGLVGFFGPSFLNQKVPVRRFRVGTDDGRQVQCCLRGETTGGEVEKGDPVEVTGRWSGSSHGATLNVTSVINHTTGSRVSAKLPIGMTFDRRMLAMSVGGLVLLVGAGAGSLVDGFGSAGGGLLTLAALGGIGYLIFTRVTR